MSPLSDDVLDHLKDVAELPDLSNTKYNCIEKIASGGMGTVYLAEDELLQRNVALKILNIPDSKGELTNRMLQEAHVIAALEHPGIVPIHDVGTLPDGRIYYVMKLIKGMRLDDKVQEQISLPEFLRIFQKVCETVAFAHNKDVIHRDLKPENIMVADFGEVLVVDWGLAKILNKQEPPATKKQKSKSISDEPPAKSTQITDLTEHGTVMGTPLYMSPEQASGEVWRVDARTDIYALGTILDFSLRAGQKKFGFGKKLPRQLLAIAAKAKSESQNERYVDAIEVVHEIDSFLNGGRVTAYKEKLWEIIWRHVKQHKFIIFLIIVYILAKLIVTFLGNL